MTRTGETSLRKRSANTQQCIRTLCKPVAASKLFIIVHWYLNGLCITAAAAATSTLGYLVEEYDGQYKRLTCWMATCQKGDWYQGNQVVILCQKARRSRTKGLLPKD